MSDDVDDDVSMARRQRVIDGVYGVDTLPVGR